MIIMSLKQSKSARWRKLDNAAKAFPATASKKDARVFRFYCELKEDVRQEVLQEALDKTLEKYPLFKTVLRRGLFWFYLEESDFRPIVKEEYKRPCSILYVEDETKFLFRVNYFKCRINFEVFHVLTDGTGASHFIKELVKNYLVLRYPEEHLRLEPVEDEFMTIRDQELDSFTKYYTEDAPKHAKRKKKAYQFHGVKFDFDELQVTEGVLSVREVLKKAKAYGVSMTVYLTAVLFCAFQKEMSIRQMRHPVVFMVPVNLRKFFPSESMTNFFGWIDPGYQFGKGKDSFEEVLEETKRFFAEELTKDKMAARMNSYISLEKHPILRFAPLALKNWSIQAGAYVQSRDLTAIFSNMGTVNLPEEFRPYIQNFGVYTSTPKIELCMCSFEDDLVLNFTSQFDSMNVQRNFFKILKEQGIHIEYPEDKYPEIEEPAVNSAKFQQWLNFSAIALAVLMVALNVLATPERLWSLFAVGIDAMVWVLVSIAFKKRRNLLKNAMWQLLWISIVCVILDLITGWRGWSVEIAYPVMTLLVQFFMYVLSKVQNLETKDYMVYYFMACIAGLIPLLLMLFGVVSHIRFLSVICLSISVLIVAGFLIFKRKEVLLELQKNLHFK